MSIDSLFSKLRYLPLFILGFSGIFGTSKGLVISALVFLAYYIRFRPRLPLFKNKLVWRTWILFFVSLCTFSLSIFLSDPSNDYKFVVHVVEMAIPFLLFSLYCYDDLNCCLLFAWRGMCLGTLLHGICVIFIKASGMVRPYNWVGIANDIGGMFTMVLFVVAGGLYYIWHNKYDRLFGISAFVVGFLALIASYSRGAIGSFVIAFCVVGIIATVLGLIKVNRKFIITISCVGLFLLMANLLFGQNPLQARSYDSERVGMRISSMRMFMDHPASGVGFGNFNREFRKECYRSKLSVSNTFTHPHNIYWHYLSQGGIVGTVGVACMFFYQMYVLVKEFVDKKNAKWIRILALCMFGLFVSILVHGWVDVNFERRNYKRLFWVLWGFYCLALFCYENNFLNRKVEKSNYA